MPEPEVPEKLSEKQNWIDRQIDQLLKLLNDRLFKPLDQLTILLRLFLVMALTIWFGFTAVDLWQSVSFNVIHRPIYHVSFAVGGSGGESYILGKAIKQVVENYHANIRLDLLETIGSVDNINRLESREADLITVQSDITPGPNAQTVATLYRDLFQLIVQDKTDIQQFTDLQGKRIGVQRESGQFLSFLEVANHFELTVEDFDFVGVDDDEAAVAFEADQVDAIFRVRAPGNWIIQDLVEYHCGRLVPIDQVSAMRIKHSAFKAATIPKGTYRGSNPIVPVKDIPTVGVYKMLYASKRANKRVVQAIATILKEHHQEISNAISRDTVEVKPLVANIGRPSSSFGIPIHPGAIAAYKQTKTNPSFVVKNFDFLALLLSIVVPIASWIWELRSRAEKRGKSLCEGYISDVIKVMDDDDNDAAEQTLEERQKRLYQIFDRAAKKLVDEDISQEAFRTFNEAYKTACEKIERDIEAKTQHQQSIQQHTTAQYIQDLVVIHQADSLPHGDSLQQMELVLHRVLDDLACDRISQESFRTFIEVYNTTKESLQQNTRTGETEETGETGKENVNAPQSTGTIS
ncbi:TAXI family TRAP transporter solute-binding subunit [Leptothoe spongobia]|uniref:TAXI family TRAP transporter solute-binding subunit n=1 Tax=Leptothoe spongobia TAU-MAC 1115 TaxID=1967444 RepID=A0A947GKT9_9CYAN|nr:TAXI family TRAP transporter solute-binding subunit [Leptothoe spongobia]MBT9314546.1 TAXI family TRAP transporter solute-binding subunit [Leptothoe spongobia TAU-MAC 1115]